MHYTMQSMNWTHSMGDVFCLLVRIVAYGGKDENNMSSMFGDIFNMNYI